MVQAVEHLLASKYEAEFKPQCHKKSEIPKSILSLICFTQIMYKILEYLQVPLSKLHVCNNE
jgi:hypothetical protein